MIRWAVSGSVPLLTIGMGSRSLDGLAVASGGQADQLLAPGFIVMGLLWLGMISLFGWLFSRQQSSGKIVAWRTLWACGFLIVTMICLEVFTEGIHGKKPVERAHWPVLTGEPILVVSLRDRAHAGLIVPATSSQRFRRNRRQGSRTGQGARPTPSTQRSTLNSGGRMNLQVVFCNHQTACLSVRERLAFSSPITCREPMRDSPAIPAVRIRDHLDLQPSRDLHRS